MQTNTVSLPSQSVNRIGSSQGTAGIHSLHSFTLQECTQNSYCIQYPHPEKVSDPTLSGSWSPRGHKRAHVAMFLQLQASWHISLLKNPSQTCYGISFWKCTWKFSWAAFLTLHGLATTKGNQWAHMMLDWLLIHGILTTAHLRFHTTHSRHWLCKRLTET